MGGSAHRHWAEVGWVQPLQRIPAVDPELWAFLSKPVLIAIVAAAKVTVAVALLRVSLHPAVLGTAMLAAITVYLHNDATDLTEDAINRAGSAGSVLANGRTIRVLAGAAYLGALALATAGGALGVGITLLPAVAAVLYSEPWLPGPGVNRLKEVVVLNTVLVAGAWAIPIAVLPLTVVETGGLVPAAFVTIFVFLRTVTGVEVMNVRDVAGDRAAGVGTLPVRFGISTTRRILWGLDGLTLVVLAAGVSVGLLGAIYLMVLGPAILYSAVVTALLGSDRDHRLLGHAKDGEYLLMAIGVLMAPGIGI